MNVYSRTFGPVRAGQGKMKAISMTENRDGGPGRGEIPAAAQDLAPAPVEKNPLTDQEDSARRPHLEVTPEMVTAFMREFEKWSPLLRYKEAEGWHTVDRLGVRYALIAALEAAPAARSRVLP